MPIVPDLHHLLPLENQVIHTENSGPLGWLRFHISLYHFLSHTDINTVTGFIKRNGEKINILQNVGGRHEEFGLRLLKDDDGHIIAEITGDIASIKRQIITQWVNGKGMPLTWESLAEVADSMGLRILAQDIREGTSQ